MHFSSHIAKSMEGLEGTVAIGPPEGCYHYISPHFQIRAPGLRAFKAVGRETQVPDNMGFYDPEQETVGVKGAL